MNNEVTLELPTLPITSIKNSFNSSSINLAICDKKLIDKLLYISKAYNKTIEETIHNAFYAWCFPQYSLDKDSTSNTLKNS